MELVRHVCQFCGEDIGLQYSKSTNGVVTCPYCGNTFTTIKYNTTKDIQSLALLGEQKLSLMRFLEAQAAYLNIISKDEKEPEGYFGLALAKFKVRFIKDEVNQRLQPILMEVGEKNFLDDENYLKALSLSTPEQKKEYEEKAKEIDAVRKEFLRLKNSGVSYGTFICVKVSDDNGEKTKDYYRAFDIYYYLKDKGLNPFLSEVSLKGQTGSDYEAHILYALTTSATMIIVCDNKDYLETNWVKNEYVRYLNMIENQDKAKKSIAIVYNENEINRLPNVNGLFTSIDSSKPTAFEQINDFINQFDKGHIEAKAAREKKEMEDLLKKQEIYLADLQKETKKELDNLRKLNQEQLCEMFDINGSALIGPKDRNQSYYVIPDKVTSIDDGCFRDCSNLLSVEIGKNIQSLDHSVFSGCTSLNTVIIGPNVKRIYMSFIGCPSLVNIEVDKANPNFKSIDGSLYSNDGKTLVKMVNRKDEKIIILDGVEVIEADAIANNDYVKEIVFPNSFKKYKQDGISKCKNLKKITFGNGVEEFEINNGVSGHQCINVKDCPSLVEFSIPKSNFFFATENGYIYDKDLTTAIGVPTGIEDVEFIDGVNTISEAILFNNPNVKSVSMPDTVNEIGAHAFSHTNITTLKFPSAVKVLTDYVGASCPILVNLDLGRAERIEHCAFTGCTSLEEVIIPDTVKFIGDNAFTGFTNIKRIVIGANVSEISQYICNSKNLQEVCIKQKKPLFGMPKGWNKDWIKVDQSVKYVWNYKG